MIHLAHARLSLNPLKVRFRSDREFETKAEVGCPETRSWVASGVSVAQGECESTTESTCGSAGVRFVDESVAVGGTEGCEGSRAGSCVMNVALGVVTVEPQMRRITKG